MQILRRVESSGVPRLSMNRDAAVSACGTNCKWRTNRQARQEVIWQRQHGHVRNNHAVLLGKVERLKKSYSTALNMHDKCVFKITYVYINPCKSVRTHRCTAPGGWNDNGPDLCSESIRSRSMTFFLILPSPPAKFRGNNSSYIPINY
jgi:hypothetical protein